MTLAELLERVEGAKGADREIDGEIMFDLFAKPVGRMEDGGPRGYLWPEDNASWSFGMRFPGKEREWFKPTPDKEKIVIPRDGACVLMNSLRVPALTASLDAAIALVERMLPGWGWSINSVNEASVYSNEAEFLVRGDTERYAILATPALALIAAMLKALIAQQEIKHETFSVWQPNLWYK